MAKKFYIMLSIDKGMNVQELYKKDYIKKCVEEGYEPLDMSFDTPEEAMEAFEVVYKKYVSKLRDVCSQLRNKYSTEPEKVAGRKTLREFWYRKRIEKDNRVIMLRGNDKGNIRTINIDKESKGYREDYFFWDYRDGRFDLYEEGKE